MANSILVIGVGPGNPDYITPAALKLIHDADVLVGGERLLESFANLGKELFAVKNNLAVMVDFIKERRQGGRVAVLAAGDPAFYGIMEYLKKHFAKSELTVVPGISSVQLACARLGISWHNAVFFSVHGRDGGGLEEMVRNHRKVFVLTDPKRTPAVIDTTLAKAGIKNRKIYICESLSYPDERVAEYSIGSVPEDAGRAGCVVAIVASC